MTSNQHYEYDDDDSGSHLRQQPQQHHRRHQQHDSNNNDNNNNTFQEKSRKTCIEACDAMSSVNDMTMCGGLLDEATDKLSKFHPSYYFNRNNLHNHDDEDPHSSPYLYSPSAPVGPTSCEYCGTRNTDDCTSNLPEEYRSFMDNYGEAGAGENKNGNNADGRNDNTAAAADNDDDGSTNNANNSQDNNEDDICPRPKLFFLKKRPPFATPDGWNPNTDYRMNLFEPPSSVEGMGRGWGEVRGHLGSNAGTAPGGGGVNTGAITTTGGGASNNNLNRSYANSGCGSSVCGGGGADTEISFSSGGGGGGGNNDRYVSASDGGRSLSPVQWVSGLMGALSPPS
mmetsp:Transcript_29559/g.62708  ORF Transcript_29559/g.62708 Transcript_29559/m.62708 type:complete len:341 (+) Transcript_29559:163-1185(+)|eukprot:CAMPEP_0172312494 /NCGR_PEP_ID=MMETSP1058-20130122/17685_1 /TAXON_ID=83371 /ORGANISM="Detonula confervacea, Strain CCMP 353" /LENGTH=340 /DNA_ID=CAMNT_0013025973 /DNA_START=95 /DNA_END=1120 /DNA_ORIENTATION=+